MISNAASYQKWFFRNQKFTDLQIFSLAFCKKGPEITSIVEFLSSKAGVNGFFYKQRLKLTGRPVNVLEKNFTMDVIIKIFKRLKQNFEMPMLIPTSMLMLMPRFLTMADHQ